MTIEIGVATSLPLHKGTKYKVTKWKFWQAGDMEVTIYMPKLDIFSGHLDITMRETK